MFVVSHKGVMVSGGGQLRASSVAAHHARHAALRPPIPSLRARPGEAHGWRRRRTPKTCAGSPSAGCRPGCSTTSTVAPRTRWRCGANRDAFGRYEFRPRVLRDVSKVDTISTLLGSPVPFPLVLAPTGYTRIADPQGELAVARAAATRRRAVHVGDHGDAFDRGGRRRQRRRAPMVPGVRLERPRPRARHGRAGCRGRLRGARHHRRHRQPGRRERDVRRGFTLPPKLGLDTIIDGHRPPGLDVALRAVRADPLRQRRHVEGRRRPVRRVAADPARREGLLAVRSDTVVERHRVVPLDLERGDRAQGGADRRRRHASPSTTASRRSPSPTTVAANSTARRRSSNWSPRSPTRSAGGSRSSVTAAYDGGATSSRRWPSAPTPAWSGGPTSTASARPVSWASTACSSGCSTSCAGRWP